MAPSRATRAAAATWRRMPKGVEFRGGPFGWKEQVSWRWCVSTIFTLPPSRTSRREHRGQQIMLSILATSPTGMAFMAGPRAHTVQRAPEARMAVLEPGSKVLVTGKGPVMLLAAKLAAVQVLHLGIPASPSSASICLHLPPSACICLHLPASACICLHPPPPASTRLHLPPSPCRASRSRACSARSRRWRRI